MNFYTIVVVVAASILILCLIGMGIIMSSTSKNANFPPTKGPCPDGWKAQGNVCLVPKYSGSESLVDDTGKPIILNIGVLNGPDAENQKSFFFKDTHGISKTTGDPLDGTTSVDFNNAGWSNGILSTTCAQAKWAKSYGIAWDGITNYNGC
jgi:hypothetical protein